MMELHNIPPLYDRASRILILGSFPSVKSREGQFFYHHPQNRFWPVMAGILGVPVPNTIDEKAALLHGRGIALWDVIAACEISGSSDSSIRQVIPNDVMSILRAAPIQAIFCNGQKSLHLYQRYLQEPLGRSATGLPSTSPANAAWSLQKLTDCWRAALIPFLEAL